MTGISNNQSGFTTAEIVIVVFFIVLLFCAGCNLGPDRIQVKEAEVKSNIHTIQIALERYAIDSGGIYPLILYGGDRTDTFTTRTTPDHKTADGKTIKGISEFDGDIDVLLEYGYLSQYPRNPFQRRRDTEKYGALICTPAEYNLPQLDNRVAIWGNHPNPVNGYPDRSKQLTPRKVGGAKGDLMWDISEEQRHSPFPIIDVPNPDPDAPTNYYHYVNPQDPSGEKYETDHHFSLMPGNFYYYPTFTNGGSLRYPDGTNPDDWSMKEVTGYNLAGYGHLVGIYKGECADTYNVAGDYPDRSLNTANNPDAFAKESYDIDMVYTGPDGRFDGVIIVVQQYQNWQGIREIDEID